MAKRRKGISDKRVNTLLRRINRIRSNYKTNREYLQAKYGKMLEKSAHFERTALREDIDIFDINYEIIMANPKSIKTNKKVRNKAIKFIETYKEYGSVKYKTAKKRFASGLRNEWIEGFRHIGVDEHIFERIKQAGLWDNSDFWRGFFNSKWFIVKYKNDSPKDVLQLRAMKLNRLVNGKECSVWGENLYNYFATEWLNKGKVRE